MHIRRSTLITGVIIALGTAPAAADEPARPPRVGVVIELAVDVEPGRADAIGAALADGLNRELKVDASGGDEVTRRLPPDGLPDECLAHPACVKDVAARIDAEQLLFLVVVQLGADVQVDASWVDVATGTVSARPRVILAADANAVSAFAQAAERYLPDAQPRKTETIIIGGPTSTTAPGSSRHMTTASWITGGTAVAVLAGAGVLGLTVRSSYGRCERLMPTDEPCSEDELDRIGRRALYADLTLGVGVAAAIATVILYARSEHDPEATRVGVAPTPGGGVVGVAGRW